MVKVKRRLFDEDADWVPAKGRIFTMKKQTTRRQEQSDNEQQKTGGYSPRTPMAPTLKVSFTKDLSSALAGAPITDKTGLENAYSQGDTYAYGDTLYIAGTHNLQDVFDDVSKVPVWGDVRQSARYQAAEKALEANPNIKRVVGHSLGGSVALELQKNHTGLDSRTYGAPVWDPTGQDKLYGKVERYRNLTDPVSFFDGSANNRIKWNPFTSLSLTHSFDNIATDFQAGGNSSAFGWKNPDGSISLTQ